MHSRIHKVLSEGFYFDNVFLVDGGIEDPNNAINVPFCWWAGAGPTSKTGLVGL